MSTPEALFRNAIDLNRYSNSVARRLINAYNDIILDAVDQLRAIDELAAPAKAARLRAIIAQLRDSLSSWAGDATELTAIELQGLAELQSEFVAEQLRQVLPAGVRDAVRTVEISPQFAQSVVTTDPTQINVVALSDDLYKSVYGTEALARQAGAGVFNLTAAQGTMITLPNGEIVRKAFRGIAVDQAERFSQVVRNGLLTGEPTPAIAKRLKGTLQRSGDRLQFGEPAVTAGQRRAAGIKDTVARGGDATRMADNQILTLVRTSVNQVANAASQQVYEANQDITKKYRYVATLDSRTSAICRALDGKVFDYGKGPTPPQHFSCRSTTVPVIDYKQLSEDFGFEVTPPPAGRRAAAGGPVPADMTYGEWLATPRPAESSADHTLRKARAFGFTGERRKYQRSDQEVKDGKAKAGEFKESQDEFMQRLRKSGAYEQSKYFDQLSRKHGPQAAIAKLVRDDGRELTLAELRKRYGNTKP